MQWDERLTRRGAQFVPFHGMPGDPYWQLVSARWLDERESGGRHHILLEVVEDGQRAVGVPVYLHNGGRSQHLTEPKPGEPFAQAIPMYASGWGYTITVGDKSDAVSRLGLGTLENPHVGAHTSYAFTFRRSEFDAGEPTPPEPEPPRGDDWEAVLQLAEKVRDIAARNVGAAQQRAVWTFEPELAAVTGRTVTADAWTQVGDIFLKNATHEFCVAVRLRKEGSGA